MKEKGNRASFDARFLLYLAGTGMWLAFTSFSGSSYVLAGFSESGEAVRVAQMACFSLSFFALALVQWLRGPFRRYTLVSAVVLTYGASVALSMASELFELPEMLRYLSASLLALSSACGYCQWFCILEMQGYRRAQWLLAGGSLFLIATMFFFGIIPDADTKSFATFAVFAPMSMALLLVNVWMNVVSDTNRHASVDGSTIQSPRTVERGRGWAVAKDLALPILCAMAIVLITPIANAAFGSPSIGSLSGEMLLPLAHLCALALLMTIWFILEKDVTLPQFYCAFLPAFASTTLLLPLFDSQHTWVIVFVGDAGFLLVSVLMATTCLWVAKKHKVRAAPAYCLFASCVYLSNVAQLVLKDVFSSSITGIGPYAIALLLLYLLVIPAFFIVVQSRGKWILPNGHQKKERDGLDSAGLVFGKHEMLNVFVDGAEHENLHVMLSDTSMVCSHIACAYHLSTRQAEVLSLLARGRDVPYIASTLYLSPNTVRSYRKNLYAALGIHGKQELIDLVEAERKKLKTE